MAKSCYAEPVAAGQGRCSRARAQPELPKDVGDVAVHGVLAQNEARRDVAIRQSLGDEIEHLQLASAQSREWAVGRFDRRCDVRS